MILAGRGGQGVLELANWLAYLHLARGRHVAYTPSYGPETRGGRVKCYVVASNAPIDSPIAEEPDLLVVMNIPSMDYLPLLRPGVRQLVNSSLVKDAHRREDVEVTEVPAAELAPPSDSTAPGRDGTPRSRRTASCSAPVSPSGARTSRSSA